MSTSPVESRAQAFTTDSRRRVLVTGGAGMLGAAFAEAAASNFPGIEVKALGHSQLDVRDPAALAAWSDWVAGGWIIHCAALVDVEKCARQPELGRSAIVDGTRNVANLARDAGARVFYPQTFLIYGDTKTDISENQSPSPLSQYGSFKYEAEQIVCHLTKDPLIVRMAGFFGGEQRDKNFVGRVIPTMQKAMAAGNRDFEIGDRVWQPTWTRDLARNSLALIKADRSGTYQMASRGEASYHEIGEVIIESLGWSDRLRVKKVSAKEVEKDMSGSRPSRAVLACERLRREGMDLQRPWRESLMEYLSGVYFDMYRHRREVVKVA